MAFIYTRSHLKARVNAGIHGKQGMLVDFGETLNQCVRQAFTDIDFRSARRKTALTPNLYNGIFDYACPSDLHSMKLIDVPAQAARSDGSFYIVPTEEFDTNPKRGMIAIDYFNGTRVLKLNSDVDSKSIVISTLDSTTAGGGTWSGFGDVTTVESDNSDFIKENGSLSFDINSAAGTTAGIVNSSVTSVDLSDYFGGTSSIFVWAKINSTTNLTNYILRFGSSASDYHSKTVTTQHDGTAFVAGWNLLRFDVTSLTTAGSPVNTAMTYFAVYMTKTSAKVSETDYKFDHLVIKKGVIHNVKYHTSYGWQTAAGAYIANSTLDTDILVAESDEYEILIKYGIEFASREIREYDIAKEYERLRKEDVRIYQMRNPSEVKIITSEYYTYG